MVASIIMNSLSAWAANISKMRANPSISPVRRLPFAVTLRQVTPGDAGAIPIDHRIHEQTVVGGRTAGMAFPAGQEILDLFPLIVAQSIAVRWLRFSEGSGSFQAFPGSLPIASPPPLPLQKRIRSQGPLLHRHYPASSLERPCPTPAVTAA
jgi:hypothetical protein